MSDGGAGRAAGAPEPGLLLLAEKAAVRRAVTAATNRLRSEGAKVAQGSFLLETTNRAMAQIFEQRSRRSLKATQLAIDQLERELRTTVRRLRDTEIASRNEAAMAELAMLAVRAGFEGAEFGPQLHGGMNRIGWRLTLRKPA